MSFSSLLHLLFHLLILSPSSLSSPPQRKETLNYQQISHKPVDKPQSIGGIIPSSSERPRKQNNEREILQNIKMSESELPELPPKAKKAMAQNLNRFCGVLH